MADNATIGFGLLGAGLIAPFHAKSIQAAAGCELVAIADLDAGNARARHDRVGDCSARVASAALQPGSLSRADGEREGAGEDLSFARLGNRGRPKLEIGGS